MTRVVLDTSTVASGGDALAPSDNPSSSSVTPLAKDVPNINGRVGGGGGVAPRLPSPPGSVRDKTLPHIDDLTADPVNIDPNKPLNSLVEDGVLRIKMAEAMSTWGQSALALREYVTASVIALEIVPRHKDYPSLRHDRPDIGSKHEKLLAAIRAAHPKFEAVKTLVVADNERSGVQPKRPRAAGHSMSRTHSRTVALIPDHGDNNGLLDSSNSRPSSWQQKAGRISADSVKSLQANTNSSPFAAPASAASISNTQSPRAVPAASAAAAGTLTTRLGKLGGPAAAAAAPSTSTAPAPAPAPPSATPPRIQDPRIKTRPIVPLKQPATGPRTVSATSVSAFDRLPSLSTVLPSLPKLPDAIYSPARGTVSSEAAQLPSSTPRGLFSRTPSTTSMATATPSIATATPPPYGRGVGTGYFGSIPVSASAALSHAPNDGPRQLHLNLDDGVTITAEKLFEVRSLGARVLLIDVRPRDQFDAHHIKWHAVVCVEPAILERPHIAADDIASSNVVAPEDEQRWFDTRNHFDLVVFYDESSKQLKSSPRNPTEHALLNLYTALTEYNYGKELARTPRLLYGGLDAWKLVYGQVALASSPATSLKLKPTKRHRFVRGSVASNYIPKPLKPEEVRKWSQTLENDTPHAADEEGDFEDEDGLSLDVARTTAQFMQRYPDINAQKESMTSPSLLPATVAQYPPSGRTDLSSELMWVPTRPAPVVPRPSNSGFSDAAHQAHATAAHMAAADPKTMVPAGNQYTGLNNPNNWCYANSSLQALLAAVPFSRELRDKQWDVTYKVPRKANETIDNPQLMIKILSNLFYWMGSSQFKVMKAQTLMNYCRHLCHQNPDIEAEFGGDQQQDAHEFTLFLMANLHEETNIRRDRPAVTFQVKPGADPAAEAERYWQHHLDANNSIITKYWTGVRFNQRSCKHCKHRSYTFETFDQLSLGIARPKDGSSSSSKTVTLEECLFKNLSPERLDGYKCDNCKTVDNVVQQGSLARLPELLCISLNRFHRVLNPVTLALDIEKNSQKVTWDFDNIALDAFVMANVPGAHHYECFAVVVHSGNRLDSGHYYTYVRDPHSSFSPMWYLANDPSVRPHGIPRPGSQEKDTILQNGASSPYILYLRRKRTLR